MSKRKDEAFGDPPEERPNSRANLGPEGFGQPNDEAWTEQWGSGLAAGVSFCATWWLFRATLLRLPPSPHLQLFRAPLLTKGYSRAERKFLGNDPKAFIDRGQGWWRRALGGARPGFLRRFLAVRCPRPQDLLPDWAPCAPCDWLIRANFSVEKLSALLAKHSFSEEEPLYFVIEASEEKE